MATAPIMQERFAPSRPLRLGTRRRAPKGARCVAAGGRAPAKRAASLDTGKHLATTVREWSRQQLTEHDVYRSKIALHRQLTDTYHRIWQEKELRNAENPTPENFAARAKWEKRWMRTRECQTEWVGYYADCCRGFTAPVAVPIGCNDRLCPLCCRHRAARARKRIRTMFDRLSHPALITLTIPNLRTIRKHNFTLFRQRVRQFIKQHAGWIVGGVYSLECTYNRRDGTWHIHVHVLADLSAPLPPKSDLVDVASQRIYRFTAIKRRMEFDWLRLWRAGWGKRCRCDASAQRRAGDEYAFEEWMRQCHAHRLKDKKHGVWGPREDLTPQQLQLCFEWNQENRIVVDIKPVIDREGAALEVLKYITKSAAFSDLPEAVEPFQDAVKGARLIQTFGSWYGVKLDEAPDANRLSDWGEMHCSCGLDAWKRLGVFSRKDVEMESSGRWRLRRPHDWKSPGTVPRPTIRALDVREE